MTMLSLSSFDRILESTHGVETNYLRILYYDFPHYFKDNYHTYEYPRFCTILNGQKKVECDGQAPFIYDNTQFLLLPPNSSVLMEISIPTRAFVLEINENLMRDVSEKISNQLEVEIPQDPSKKCFDFLLSPHVEAAFQHILNTCFSSDRNRAFLLDLYAQELAYHLISTKSLQGIIHQQVDNPIQLTIGFMSENWDEKVSLIELAEMANMSVNTYLHQFKKLTGVTPTGYRTGIKMVHAREMLRTRTVTETALELGYENISHFIHLFKIKYGITPKQFQKLFAVNLPETIPSDFSIFSERAN